MVALCAILFICFLCTLVMWGNARTTYEGEPDRRYTDYYELTGRLRDAEGQLSSVSVRLQIMENWFEHMKEHGLTAGFGFPTTGAGHNIARPADTSLQRSNGNGD